jgi:hypothetical protein
MKYSGRWTAGLNDKDKAVFEELLGVNNKVLDRLSEICYNMIKGSENSESDYDNPNWPYRMADHVGFRRALNQIATLCEQVKERDPA